MGILLDTLPGFTFWGGIVSTIVMAVISWLFKAAHDSLKEKFKELENDVNSLRNDNERVRNELREIRDNMHKLNLELMKQINDVGIKIAEFKRDISK